MLKLSIITVVYNGIGSLEGTIQSVLNIKKYQEEIEYIVIDGASNDGTVDVIKSYNNSISYWVSEPDNGIYDAMNKGIKAATGDFLIFMNSGDVFYDGNKSFLKKMFSILDTNKNFDIIYGNTVVKNKDIILKIPIREINSNFFFYKTICHQSVFFNKNVFKNLGNYNLDYKIISDRDLLFRVANSKGKFYHIDINISIWDEEGFSKDNNMLLGQEEMKFKNKNFSIIKQYYLRFKKRSINLFHKSYLK